MRIEAQGVAITDLVVASIPGRDPAPGAETDPERVDLDGRSIAGRLRPDGSFHATEVLAKHDENYMPPPAAAALEQGQRGRPQP